MRNEVGCGPRRSQNGGGSGGRRTALYNYCVMTDVLPDELARGAAELVRGALGGHGIRQVWTDHDRILFRLADGRTGDVELLVNWDVGELGIKEPEVRLGPPRPGLAGRTASTPRTIRDAAP